MQTPTLAVRSTWIDFAITAHANGITIWTDDGNERSMPLSEGIERLEFILGAAKVIRRHVEQEKLSHD